MPRKKSISAAEYDYDDDYDVDDDYEEEDGNTGEGYHEYQHPDTVVEDALGATSTMWRCSTCTYDNPAAFLSCEVCGTTRSQETVKVEHAASVPARRDPFAFDSPSPDDIVMRAQSGASRSGPGKASAIPPPRPSPAPRPSTSGRDDSTSTSTPIPSNKRLSAAGKTTTPSPMKMAVAESPIRRFSSPSALDGGPSRAGSMAAGSGASPGGAEVRRHSLGSALGKAAVQSMPLESYVPEPELEEILREEGKPRLSLIVVGHVDAGKSTLMGHLLHDLGCVPQKEMHKAEKEAKEKGKGSFAYAWLLDEGSEERARGITMSVALQAVDRPAYDVVLMDAPGHADFIPSVIAGASQADAAVLVVDATPGAFEAGMGSFDGASWGGDGGWGGGQTREHAQLARSLGVEQLVVAVNKMDAVGFEQGRFEEIKAHLSPFLGQCGFRGSAVRWVPVAGLAGDNLTALSPTSPLAAWYLGPTLLSLIDSFSVPPRQVSKPLRFVVAEVLRSHSLGAVAVGGRLEGGGIRPGTKVAVMPGGHLASVRAIERVGVALACARAGDSVDVGLAGAEEARAGGALAPGSVLCHPSFPVPVVTRFSARILTLALQQPLLLGAQVVVHAHSACEAGSVAELVSVLDNKTGAVVKSRPRCLMPNQAAMVELVLERALCLELYTNYRMLGRVALRDGGKTLAVGIVTDIMSAL